LRPLRWLLLAVGVALLVLLIFKIGPQRMLTAWAAAPKGPVMLAAALFTATMLLRVVKWQVLLRGTTTPTGYANCAQAYFLNAFLANLTPARSGEMLAPVWLARHRVPLATGAAVLIVDRTIDLLAVLALFFLAAWNLSRLAPSGAAEYRVAGVVVAALVGLALVAFIFALARLQFAARLAAKLPGRLGERLSSALTSLRTALIPFRNRNVLVAVGGITLAGWLLDMLATFTLVRAFLPQLTYLESATASMFACLAAILSFIPGGIGIGAAGYTGVLAVLGFDATLAGSAAVLWTIIAHAVRAALAAGFSRRP
jgi:uncharacterized protein (TIRG00374 family)